MGRAERIRDWMSFWTSQTLTFMPATTAPAESQKAMNSPVAAVDRGDGDTLAQVDAVLGVPVGGVHVDRGARLGAEQHDLAVESFVPQRLGGLGRGQPAACDHIRRHGSKG
jgi:hypothetical protein